MSEREVQNDFYMDLRDSDDYESLFFRHGIIEVFYSSSAAESGVDFYKLAADGASAELMDSFTAVGRLDGDTPVFTYSQNGGEITEEEYSTKIRNYEVGLTTALDWMQIQ